MSESNQNFGEMLTNRFSSFLSNNLYSLKIICDQPISKQLFASLAWTKKLYLRTSDSIHINVNTASHNLQTNDVTECIELMPSLEEVSLDRLCLLRVPTTLRRLSLIGPPAYFAEHEFFVTISQNTVLRDRQLFFTPALLNHLTSDFSPMESSILDQAELPNLVVLQVCTTQTSMLLTRFSVTLLRACTSLKELKLCGVGLTNEIILGTKTTSLRKVALSDYRKMPAPLPPAVAGARLAETDEGINWSTIDTLLKRNPNVSALALSFTLGLPPLTYHDIESFSSNCPRLNYVELYSIIMGKETVDRQLRRKEILPYTLEWLYTRGSATEDMFIKDMFSYGYNNEDDEINFVVRLINFGEQKDAAVDEV